MFLHPFDGREEVMDPVARGMRLAIENVKVQCKVDMLAGRYFSFVHVTSHPTEFSDMERLGVDGKENIGRLEAYFDELLSMFNAKFLTVSELVDMWESESCHLHSERNRD